MLCVYQCQQDARRMQIELFEGLLKICIFTTFNGIKETIPQIAYCPSIIMEIFLHVVREIV